MIIGAESWDSCYSIRLVEMTPAQGDHYGNRSARSNLKSKSTQNMEKVTINLIGLIAYASATIRR